MRNKQRFWLLMLIDLFMVLTAVFFGAILVNAYGTIHIGDLFILAFMVGVLTLCFSIVFQLYKTEWEYATSVDWFGIFNTVSCSILTTAILQFALKEQIIIGLLVLVWLMNIVFMGGWRVCMRMFRGSFFNTEGKEWRVLIVGAGSAGTMVADHLHKQFTSRMQPIGFLDDDPAKQNLYLLGIPVLGKLEDIEVVVGAWKVDEIIIAIPSLSKSTLSRLFQICMSTNCQTKMLPDLEEILSGKAPVSEFRDVQVEDLLGRDPVQLDTAKIVETIKEQVVLITGAGGSIGSEICRQLAQFKPRKMILLGHGETSIYDIEMELNQSPYLSHIELITEIADIQDFNKMMKVVAKHSPDIIFHAAAHKHVPLMERNPDEAVKNNLIGTLNVAKAADWHRVKTFVLVSSDKAVNPTSVMGATKRLAEMAIQNMNHYSSTKFVVVRFGNVLGSRGSVIPLFKKQIQAGGPITVTHPEMVRYFMTISEASRLCVQAAALAEGGEIFVLDMGEPVRIVDLARRLITLSGYTLDEIEIQYTGIRPGEKLVEELLSKEEMIGKQVFEKIYIGTSQTIDMNRIDHLIQEYPSYTDEQLKEQLFRLIEDEKPAIMGLAMEG